MIQKLRMIVATFFYQSFYKEIEHSILRQYIGVNPAPTLNQYTEFIVQDQVSRTPFNEFKNSSSS